MPNEAELGPALSGRLAYLLKRAFFALEALHEEHMASSGVNARGLAVLLLLDAHEPDSQQQAASRLGVDRTTMVGLLDALEGQGLIERRPDAADRRRNVLALTDRGRATLDEATRASDAAEQDLLRELDADEAQHLRELLRRIAADPS
jgi:DNA-binding MarR family transcriptional regulator